MKRLYVFLSFILIIILPMKAQETPVVRPLPKDSLPDLWVITVDLSGSMTSQAKKGESPMNRLISNKVENMMRKNNVRDKDKVLLLHSGIDKTELLCSVEGNYSLAYFHARDKKTGAIPSWHYKEIEFPFEFVGKERKNAMSFSEAMSYLSIICPDNSRFKYSLSFTSLVRPLSMYILTQEKTNFLNYRNIYHVLVTDDGDANDQWNEDYRYLKKFVRPHFDAVCKILPTVACSNFDFASKQTAKFEEIASNENQPRVYLTKYITYQDGHPEIVLPSSSLLNVSDYHNSSFTLSMNPCYDSVCFVYVDSCKVNEGIIRIGRYLYPGDTIHVVYPDSLCKIFANEISAKGHYQEEYHDRILGQRYRTIDCEGLIADNLVAAEIQAKERQCLLSISVLILVGIVFFTIWRNLVVLTIFANGQRWGIKRKAMKRMRHDSFTLLTLVCKEHKIIDALYYKGKGISVRDDNNSRTSKGEDRILIKSSKRLFLLTDNRNFTYDEDKSCKNITIENGVESEGEKFHFQYADSLSHNLIVSYENAVVKTNEKSENRLRERNQQMLASYYERNAGFIFTTHNNVMINLITKESMGKDYKHDYVVLNVFDLNSQNSASHIYLRYSLMCFFDCQTTSEIEAASKMIKIADYVLKSERQKPGHFDTDAFFETEDLSSGITVDVSPMLSYLYLLKKGKSRMVYSPFADGECGLKGKTVKIFPKETMTLLNLPVIHKHPEIKKDDDMTAKTIDKCFRKKETLTFIEPDIVEFANSGPVDYAYGRKDYDINGVSFLSWKLDDVILNTII